MLSNADNASSVQLVQPQLVSQAMINAMPGSITRANVKLQKRQIKSAAAMQKRLIKAEANTQRKELKEVQKREKQKIQRQRIRDIRTGRMAMNRVTNVVLPSVSIVGQETLNDTTYFVIQCRTETAQWQVQRRYKEFDALRRTLGVRPARVGSSFPSKTWFRACTGEALECRQTVLAAWLRGLVSEFCTGGDGRNRIVAKKLGPKTSTAQAFLGITCEQTVNVSFKYGWHSSVKFLAVEPEETPEPQACQALNFGEEVMMRRMRGSARFPRRQRKDESDDQEDDEEDEKVSVGLYNNEAEQLDSYHVDVPAGLGEGDSFFVDICGQTYALVVPAGSPATLQFMLPPSATKEADTR